MEAISPVLAADDNADDLRLLEFSWQAAQISTPLQALSTGEEVIWYLRGEEQFSDRRRFPLPRLLLLDLKMPRTDGFEVLAWIRADPAFTCLPVLVFTASLHKQDVRRAFAAGANAFLVKPIELQKLIRMVKAIDDFWLAHNQSFIIQD